MAADGSLVRRETPAAALASPVLLAIARQALREADTLPQLARLADQAEIVRVAARKAKLTKEAQDDWGEYALDAERKAGAVLAALRAAGERASQGRPEKTCHDGTFIAPPAPTLVELGVAAEPVTARHRASRWQRLARLPAETYARFTAAVRADPDAVITQAAALRVVKQEERRAQQQQAAVEQAARSPQPALVWCERWETWLDRQEPCDVLLTDPPYMTEVSDVAGFAAAWLPAALAKVKPTGRAYVCVGAYPVELQAYLAVSPPAGITLANILVWTYRNAIGPAPALDYRLNWQAVLYYRGAEAAPLDCPSLLEHFAVQEVNAPDGRLGDRWHTWQKPDELAERFVRHASRQDDLVLDPFAGTGTFLLAAARLGRRALGCESDPHMLAIAQERGCQHAG